MHIYHMSMERPTLSLICWPSGSTCPSSCCSTRTLYHRV